MVLLRATSSLSNINRTFAIFPSVRFYLAVIDKMIVLHLPSKLCQVTKHLQFGKTEEGAATAAAAAFLNVIDHEVH